MGLVMEENGRPGFIIRLLVTAFALWVASVVVKGIRIEGMWTLLIAALLFGIVNAFIRPLIVLLTLPLTIVTLGLFLLVINAAMLGLVAAMLDSFHISGFFSALFGSLVVSLIGWAVSR